MKKPDFRFLFGTHLVLLIIILLWLAPFSHTLLKNLDIVVFKSLNGHLLNTTFSQWFWGILNHRLETKLNLLAAFLFNVWIILKTNDLNLRKVRIKQLLYFWLCFQVGMTLFNTVFNYLAQWDRLSPSLVVSSAIRLSSLWNDPNIKDSAIHSFPSGHAFAMFYWAFFTNLCAPKRLKIYGFILAGFLTLPRLIGGAHWFSDAYISILLSACWLSWTELPIYCIKRLNT